MAREAKKDPNDFTVEEKLKALYQLQTMLSEIDKIKTLRGELPLEVQDLEDEVAGLNTRIEKIERDIADLRSSMANKRIEIEAARVSVEKYKAQQDNVRNNREYDVLSKEIEFQTLEIELCEKRIREAQVAERTRMKNCLVAMKFWKKENKTWKPRKWNWKKLFLKLSKKKKDFAKKLKVWNSPLNRVCCKLSSVFVKIHAMVWGWYMYNVTLVAVALTRFLPRSNSISAHARKSSCANTVAVSW